MVANSSSPDVNDPPAIPNNTLHPVAVNTTFIAAAQPVSAEQLEREEQQQQRVNGSDDDDEDQKETFGEKLSRWSHNCWQSTGLCCFTAKEQSQIAALEFQIVQRQKKFGVDYLTMVLDHQEQQLNGVNNNAPQAPIAEALERCVQEAVSDIHTLQGKVDSRVFNIGQKTSEVNSKMKPAPGTPSSRLQPAIAAVVIDEGIPATTDDDDSDSNSNHNNDHDEPATIPTPGVTVVASAPQPPPVASDASVATSKKSTRNSGKGGAGIYNIVVANEEKNAKSSAASAPSSKSTRNSSGKGGAGIYNVVVANEEKNAKASAASAPSGKSTRNSGKGPGIYNVVVANEEKNAKTSAASAPSSKKKAPPPAAASAKKPPPPAAAASAATRKKSTRKSGKGGAGIDNVVVANEDDQKKPAAR